MGLLLGDITFIRSGRPAVIIGSEPKSGQIYLDDSREAVEQATNGIGLKNGLTPEGKEAFRATINKIANPDKKLEIEALHLQIQELKQQNADGRLIRYLEGDLQYRMNREKYFPKKISVDVFTVGV